MKQIILILIIFITTSSLLQAQDRVIARGAEPGELYLATFWHGVYGPQGPPYYDTLRKAVFRISNHGQNVTIQYDVDYFSDLFTPPGSVMQPYVILADKTPGVLYSKYRYSKDYYPYTQLWTSFDYGKNWVFREEDIGQKNYFSANVEGVLYRADYEGSSYKSADYGANFYILETGTAGGEPGLLNGEAFSVGLTDPPHGRLFHTHDFYITYTEIPIDSQFIYGTAFPPDVYRGATEGEVFIHSWFTKYYYRASFSSDTGYTFRHVYVNDNYQWQNSLFDRNQLLFMSDREPGVFYILNLLQEQDVSPNGFHLKLCIHYYRDYGETLIDVYCHDMNKNYVIETCEAVTDLTSEKLNNNSVFLTWTAPENSLTVEGYRVYRNHKLLTQQMITNTFYLDENLDYGNYEYNVLTYYTTGCISEISNFVSEFVEQETCKAVTDLTSEIMNNNSILLTWTEPESDLSVEGYAIFRNEQLISEQLIINTTYLDENLQNGNYKYFIVVHYTNSCISDSSNHVFETINLEENCEPVNDLISKKINDNNILLNWSKPESDLQIEGYRIYRNNTILINELVLALTYLDENLPNGTYNYYVITHYVNGCISDTSNHVKETIELGINEFYSEIVIYPNPTTGQLRITSYELRIENIDIIDIYGRNILCYKSLMSPQHTLNITHLTAGIYFIKITTEKGITIQKIIKY